MNGTKDIKYADNQSCMLDVIYPLEQKLDRTVIFFHGGGLEGGDKEQDSLICGSIANGLGVTVLNANYRLYPACAYPDYICDAAKAVKWFFDNASRYNLGKQLVIMGCSAGAYIAMMLCFDSSFLTNVGVDSKKIAAYYFDSGQPTVHFRVLKEMGFDEKTILVNERAPLFHVKKSDYPPMTVVTYTQDIEVRKEQSELLCAALKCFNHDSNKVNFKLLEGGHVTGNLFDSDGHIGHIKHLKELFEQID